MLDQWKTFPITHTMMFAILKMSVKWRLFDGIPFNETPMSWFVIVKSRSKNVNSIYVFFWVCFKWKKIHIITGTTIQVIWLNAIFFWTLKDLNVSTCLHIFYLLPLHDLQQPFFFFKRCFISSHCNVFQHFSSSKKLQKPSQKPFHVYCLVLIVSVFQII